MDEPPPALRMTPARVERTHEWIRERDERVVGIVNDVRADLGEIFETDVDPVTTAAYRAEVDAVFADGDLGLNVATLVTLLRAIDVPGDYPGFVADEILGRELAGTIAASQPLRTLGEATFHYADLQVQGPPDERAGLDDLDAALAAGFQERLPGWDWTERESPFRVG